MNGCAGVNRGKLSGAAYAGMFVFGIVMALIGAVLPALAEQFHVGVADVGSLLLAMNLTMLFCSLWIGVAIDRFGTKPPLVIGPLLVASALVLIANANRFAHMIPAVVLLGAGGSALNTATNNLVADLYEDPGRKGAALNMLGVFCGIGALFLPFCLGALLTAVGVRWLLVAAAASACSPPCSRRLPAILYPSIRTGCRWRTCRIFCDRASCSSWQGCCSSSPALSSSWAVTSRSILRATSR